MKKVIYALIFFLSLGSASAQKTNSIVLNIYGTYIFQDEIDLDQFSAVAEKGIQYGGGLEFYMDGSRSFELKYLRQDFAIPLYAPSGTQLNEQTDEGSINYIILSGTNYFGGISNSSARPFFGFGIGVAVLDSKEGGNTTKTAFDLKLGLYIPTGGRVPFKLHSSLQTVFAAVGSDYFVGAGGPIAVPDYATLLQFGFGAGLSFSLK
jgi:hypothetical protein